MSPIASPPRRRGRPPKPREESNSVQERLLQAGLEMLTEKGFTASGLDEILSRVGVPKGSFYHYFSSKEEYGLALIERYTKYFAAKLDHSLQRVELSPLKRLQAFVDDAKLGMARFEYRRGCLVGNLGQEMGALPETFRARLLDGLNDWRRKLENCLNEAREIGEIASDTDCFGLATVFWIGWEGAVLKAKLERSSEPLDQFAAFFLAAASTLPHGNKKGNRDV